MASIFFPPSRGAIHSKPSIYLCRTYHFILVFPMIISYLWFAYALHPDCRMSILSKTVEINKNGLSCTFDDGRTESIAWERITRIRYTSTDIIFHLSNYIFFILPYNSFKSNDDLEYFLKNFLALNIQNKK